MVSDLSTGDRAVGLHSVGVVNVSVHQSGGCLCGRGVSKSVAVCCHGTSGSRRRDGFCIGIALLEEPEGETD